MNWVVLAIAIAVGAVIFDYLIMRLLMSRCWGHLPRAFPAREPRSDAERRSFQSFRLGVCNFGYCIHVAVDEQHLHLTPARLLQLLGARPASVPWDAIRVTGEPRNGYLAARVVERPLLGPAWCLELAGNR